MTIYLIAIEDDWSDDRTPLEEYGYFTSEDAAKRKIAEINADIEPKYEAYKAEMTQRYETRKAQYDKLLAACLAAKVPVPEEVSVPLPPYLMSLRQWSKNYPTYVPFPIQPGE